MVRFALLAPLMLALLAAPVSANEVLEDILRGLAQGVLEEELNRQQGTEPDQPGSLTVTIDEDGVQIGVVPEQRRFDEYGRPRISPRPKLRPWYIGYRSLEPYSVLRQLRHAGAPRVIAGMCGTGFYNLASCDDARAMFADLTEGCRVLQAVVDLDQYDSVSTQLLRQTRRRTHGPQIMLFSVNNTGELVERLVPQDLTPYRIGRALEC